MACLKMFKSNVTHKKIQNAKTKDKLTLLIVLPPLRQSLWLISFGSLSWR